MRSIIAQMIAHLSWVKDAELPEVEDLRFELPAETLEARWEMLGEPRIWRGFDSLCPSVFPLFSLCTFVCLKRILDGNLRFGSSGLVKSRAAKCMECPG